MEHKVSSYEERQLTNAIERAATVASVNEELDPNNVLVQQLKKASVDPKFAETAARAFNKRLTVFNLRKTADEHKADPFELADPDKVRDMMTGQVTKVAAVNFDMTVEQLEEAEQMDKAASCQLPDVIVRDKRYEHLCSWDTFKQHLESDLEKLASAFRDVQCDLMNREAAIEQQAQEVADYFKKAAYDFDFTTAVNLYGDKLQDAIGHLVDKGVSFKKTARFVICPNKDIFTKAAKLIADKEACGNVRWFAQELATGLAEFAKSAAALGDEYQIKTAADPVQNPPVPKLDQQIFDTKANIDNLTGRIQSMQNQVNADARSGLTGARLGAAADLLAAGATGLTEGAINNINNLSNTARTVFNNAKALYYAGNNVSISPGDLLDAAFLTKDRYRDRLLAWSDMSADPQLSMYPAEQVFGATQKAMDMDTSLERPDQRELLRAQVAQLLAQNNRASTADLAALAETLKAMAAARGNAAVTGNAAVSALSDKTEPGLVELEAIMPKDVKLDNLRAMGDSALSDYDENIKQLEAIEQRGRDARKDQLKALQSERDTAQKAVQKMEETKEKREYEEGKVNAETEAKKIEGDTTQSIARSLGFTWMPTKDGKGFYVFNGGKGKVNRLDSSYVKDNQTRNVLTISQMEAIANDIRKQRAGQSGEATDNDYLPDGAIREPKPASTTPRNSHK